MACAGGGGLATVEQALADTEAELRRWGRQVYAIRVGGANAVGSQGYLNAAAELTCALPVAAGLLEGSLQPDGPVVFAHCGGAYGCSATAAAIGSATKPAASSYERVHP